MRRADRLFRLVDRLRRRRGVVTAAVLARDLEVSERTVYRDIADLQASGVPVEGEAGIGYRLERGDFDLPPLMFGEDEIEALVLGARVVEGWGDPLLAQAATDALAKIEGILPARIKDRVSDSTLFALNFRREQPTVGKMLGLLRSAVRRRRKVTLEYRDRKDDTTTRTVWPLGLFFWGPTWSVGAYCELREGFRNFRLDRIVDARVQDVTYPHTPGRTLHDLFEHYREAAESRD